MIRYLVLFAARPGEVIFFIEVVIVFLMLPSLLHSHVLQFLGHSIYRGHLPLEPVVILLSFPFFVGHLSLGLGFSVELCLVHFDVDRILSESGVVQMHRGPINRLG